MADTYTLLTVICFLLVDEKLIGRFCVFVEAVVFDYAALHCSSIIMCNGELCIYCGLDLFFRAQARAALYTRSSEF